MNCWPNAGLPCKRDIPMCSATDLDTAVSLSMCLLTPPCLSTPIELDTVLRMSAECAYGTKFMHYHASPATATPLGGVCGL